MKARCYHESDDSYQYYGARQISVCDRWRTSFDAFLVDMGERPAGTTLDRIDVNGNYEPGNCRWAGALQQAANKRDAKPVKVFGVTHANLSDACRCHGVDFNLVWKRIQRGWDIDRAFSTRRLRHRWEDPLAPA